MATRAEKSDDILAEKIGHKFNNADLLTDALTHPSLAGSKKHPRASMAYERLEFLGDRVLGLVIAAWLYELHPQAREGELSKRHASMVNRDTLSVVAKMIGLNEHLKVAKSELAAARQNKTILADACEALIGALYLDGGMQTAGAFIHHHWRDIADKDNAPPVDPKTGLQEWVQARGLPLPIYTMTKREGPAHAPHFVVEVTVKGHRAVTGEGTSKREAEKNAARQMLAKLN